MKQIVTGIVAHVDAGKTTLTEALMYKTGAIRKLGRVDNGDAFLDPNTLEKQRGITLFTHQAELTYNDLVLTLLDTPGHVDFASQTEQVLPVLDYAILVVSATDGIQGYTRTLWDLLARYDIPTFIFINKEDVIGADPSSVIKQLQKEFSPACLDFADPLTDEVRETIVMQDDTVLENYLSTGHLSDQTIQQLIKQRKVFPCYSGAALKLTGITNFLKGLEKWTVTPEFADEFAARVFKISHDDKGNRLIWVKFTPTQVLNAGQVGALTGLTSTSPGLGLGKTKPLPAPVLKPVLNYAVKVDKEDLHACLNALKELEDEDPQLQISWHPHIQEIHVQIMGEVQLQILQQLLQERYQLEVTFDEGNVLYQETITNKVEGVGHFEPLRHYAEAHLLLEPGKQGSGITISSDCSLDILDRNWQHQILTSLQAKEHLGVLTGAPLTDVKITLVGGRGHIKHTVGGDFRQASWRAVRQGLMELKGQNECQLLEPWYAFHLKVPNDQVGRAINDIQQMHGTFELDEANSQDLTLITGTAPVMGMRDYAQSVRAYTHGQGQLELVVAGYYPCHNAEDVIREVNYDPVADIENTPDSVFCAHGAGFPVPWNEVPAMAHYPYRK